MNSLSVAMRVAEINYNRKKEAFLSRTDEQNAAIFSWAIRQEIMNYVKDGE